MRACGFHRPLTRHCSLLCVLMGLALLAIMGSASAQAVKTEVAQPYGKGTRLELNEDGSSYLRILTWAQVWARYIQQNPGSLVQGSPRDHGYDIGIRRARVLLVGQLASRFQLVAHLGINNQTFNNARKPQLFMHDLWTQFQVYGDYLFVGAGLHYWNGISRLTNASTLNMMTLDAPIVNWPTIERTDQFARMLGIFFKGKIDLLDYRLAINHPFATEQNDPGPRADFNPAAFAAAFAGYLQLQLLDRESNALPYAVGTYLGQKRVLNLGAGFLYHPDGMRSLDPESGTTHSHDMLALAVDGFVDMPLSALGAITGYAAYYYYDMGPNYLRNVGVMNYATGGTSLNGAGNAYPVIGSGSHLYAQLGYLFQPVQLQPYASLLTSFFDALDDTSLVFELGLNWYLVAHHAKLTVNYRNRPIYVSDGDRSLVGTRHSEVILQAMLYL